MTHGIPHLLALRCWMRRRTLTTAQRLLQVFDLVVVVTSLVSQLAPSMPAVNVLRLVRVFKVDPPCQLLGRRFALMAHASPVCASDGLRLGWLAPRGAAPCRASRTCLGIHVE